jgi:hypothetical protein
MLMDQTADEHNSNVNLVPQVTLITKRDAPARMSKRIPLELDGKLKSDGSECRMVAGTAARAFAGTANELGSVQ